MSTSLKINSSKEKENSETFSLLWLDTEVNATSENRRTQKRLREIINYLKLFDNSNACQQYITSCSEYDRIVLIISGRLSKEIVPKIHKLRQLSSIYIFCRQRKLYRSWAKQYTKV